MKALSIMQPWAWLIVNGLKDIENRKWSTDFRGEFLVHAGKTYDEGAHIALRQPRHHRPAQGTPRARRHRRAASIVDCVATARRAGSSAPTGSSCRRQAAAVRAVSGHARVFRGSAMIAADMASRTQQALAWLDGRHQEEAAHTLRRRAAVQALDRPSSTARSERARGALAPAPRVPDLRARTSRIPSRAVLAGASSCPSPPPRPRTSSAPGRAAPQPGELSGIVTSSSPFRRDRPPSASSPSRRAAHIPHAPARRLHDRHLRSGCTCSIPSFLSHSPVPPLLITNTPRAIGRPPS
jgi:hypothetical protein